MLDSQMIFDKGGLPSLTARPSTMTSACCGSRQISWHACSRWRDGRLCDDEDYSALVQQAG
eukprot:593784-Lingulodinium_polyedra.AAC.1